MSAVPDAVVGFLLDNLKDFVVTNKELIGGAQENANNLCADLEALKGFLTECTQNTYSEDGFLSGLAKKVRKLVYKAEDAIETYIATVSKHKLRSTVKGALYAIDHAMELRNIGKELAALHDEVKSVYDGAVKDGLQVMNNKSKKEASNSQGVARKHPVDDDMVGFKDVKEEVMKYLKEGKNDLHTVSIVGMFGLGKTTLARQVFKDATVEFQFFIRAFVEVSQEFKKKEVLQKLVRQLGNVSSEDMNRMDANDLEDSIKEYLSKRNYLIVLDDVWKKEHWDHLKGCFPPNDKRSRVLITTRNVDVAQHARQGSDRFEPYQLRFLYPDESKELLRKRVFGTTDINKPDLAEHEVNILSMCKGLPLAIVVVAGILQSNAEASFWWESVSRMGTDDLAKEATYAIKMSFDYLPYRLKPCFLYLGVFREDSEIFAKTLYQLWVSEGFVEPGDTKETSEDKAATYLEQLVDRSLVMVERRRLNGSIKTVRIHDTLREFCKTQSVEEGLFREIKYGQENSPSSSPEDDRRLCINSHVKEYIISTNKRTGKFVRSFVSFAKEDFVLPLEYISEIPKAFKLLRVLDVRSIKFTRFPTELFYAFLLKYFAMCSDLKTIPEKVSYLRYLQTLIFHTTQRSIDIKADIWKMKQLRHLHTNATTTLVKSKEPQTENLNLQTLATIAPECCTPEVFKRAQHLKKLAVSGELASNMDNLFHSIRELLFLENLKLLNSNGSSPLRCLPSDTNFPRRITRLTLQNTRLPWTWMPTLSKLNQLEVLKLKENAFEGAFWDTESTGSNFVALKVLHIGNTDLIHWKASKDNFKQLKQLYFKHCTKLETIPNDLVNIATLKLIDIYCCNSVVVNSARKLVLAMLQAQNQGANENATPEEKNNKNTQLKLSIYPPEQ